MNKLNTNKLWAADITDQRVDSARKLIVPMHLEALVIGKTEPKSTLKWKSISPDYTNLNNDKTPPLGEYITQPVCETPSSIPLHGMGIHLHWVLPQAYRHGTQEADNKSPEFPFAPNRWLITRIAEKNGTTDVRRWVIESDYIHKNAAEPNWLLIEKNDHSAPLLTSDRFRPAMIGRVYDYDKWIKEGNMDASGEVFLTIMSPCDPSFAASYHSCKNIFGFYDECSVNDPDATYTYSVTGWISNPAKDLLAGITDAKSWVSKMDALSWYVTGADKLAVLPGGVLCHAMINNVVWKKGAVTQSGKPQNDIKIGVGNTVPDALATVILEHKNSGFDDAVDPFLSALQYNVMADHAIDNGRDILQKLNALNGPGANTRVLRKQAHNRSFQSVSGGSNWILSKKRKAQNGFLNGEDETEHNKPLQAPASNLLKELNDLQYQYDTALTTLHSLQAERYANWYKETKLLVKAPAKMLKAELQTHHGLLGELRQDNDRIDQLLGTLAGNNPDDSKTDTLKDYYTKKINDIRASLTKALLEDKNYEDYELTESKMPPYYAPNEPALVITGLEPSSIYTSRQHVVCRTEEQLIDTIAYTQQKADLPSVLIRYADLLSRMALSADSLPPQVSLLTAETLALSPLLARQAAVFAWNGKGSPQQLNVLASELTALLKDPAKDSGKFKNKNTTAVLPEAYAIRHRNKQPWIPLFMEWEIEWVPGYTRLQSGEVLEKWEFGEGSGKLKLNNIDYSVKAGAIAGTTKNLYKGRVALSADLGNKLKELTAILGADNILSDINPMYQSLSSLNQQLMLLESSVQLPPVKRSGNTYPVDSVIKEVEEQYLWNPSDNKNKGFYPLRSGLFRIKNLYIIDAFGQNMPLINSRSKPENNYSLHVSANMETTDNNIAMPPRLSNPARLRFKWISAQDPGRETDTDPGTSPICGWLVQNKLDKSLMVFDAEGKACGSLKLTSKNILTWMPPPGKDTIAGLADAITNSRLLGFVSSIFDAGKETFLELLQQIDGMAKKALKAKKAANNTANLPLGTPIAIAGASCQLELKDPPARDWSKNTAERSELSNISFPFYIGSNLSRKDGVIGYYVEGTGNAVKKLGLPFAQYVSAVDAQMTANQPVRLSVASGAFNAPVGTPLTLLLHPYMDVTISSGILPDATYKLPAFNMAKVLEQINFNFMINPVLVPGKKMNVPVADVAGRKWVWMEQQNKSETETPLISWATEVLQNKKSGKLDFEPVTAREGWLQIEKKD
jgi:hypothetical protein